MPEPKHTSRLLYPRKDAAYLLGISVRSPLNSTMPDKYKPPFAFSTHIGTVCAQKSRTFQDLAEKLKMDVTDLMRQCNGKTPPSKALVKSLARELEINESYLEKLR